MNIALFILFGFFPSLIWLSFYLKRDKHPEPNNILRKVFVLGMFSTIPAIFVELGLKTIFSSLAISHTSYLFLYIFIGIALTEELAKFFAVRIGAYKNKALDEPVDLMIYMIVAALGFAAAENMLALFKLGPVPVVSDLLGITLLRLLGATFLHALASGVLGYALAKTCSTPKDRLLYGIVGLFVAVLLHGLFDFFILYTDGVQRVLMPVGILVALGFFVSNAFKKLQEQSRRCIL